ncbi:MAG: hypothetical protein JNM56_17110, partial [Planctomycetia bacterium]|nr:hypothetical protein [Planctomycetia bacterium]
FVILVRKASAIRKRESVGSWLYGVAYRVAQEAKAGAACRRAREQHVQVRSAGISPAGANGTEEEEQTMRLPHDMSADPCTEAGWRELRPLLDEELNRLPEKYRAPILLCYLQGKTNDQAAAQLGWTRGTIAGRLARARDLLRERLARRGLALSAGALPAALAPESASAAVPPTLLTTTIQVGVRLAAGEAAGSGLSASVAALSEAVLRSMWFGRLKLAVLVLALGLTLTSAGWATLRIAVGSTASGLPVEAAAVLPTVGEEAVVSASWRERAVLRGHTKDVTCLATASGGQRLYSGSVDGAVIGWNPATPQEKGGRREMTGVQCLALSPDGAVMAAGTDRGLVVWDTANGRERKDLQLPGRCHSIDFSPDGRTLAVTRWPHGGWRVSELEFTLCDVGKSPSYADKLRDMAGVALARFGPDGKTLATISSKEGAVRLWDLESGNEQSLLSSPGTVGLPARALAFSPDGRHLAAAWKNGVIALWDLKNGREARELRGHTTSVSALAYSLDGQELVSGGLDDTIRIWNLGSGESKQVLPAGQGGVCSLTVLAAQFGFASGGKDGTIKVWKTGRE